MFESRNAPGRMTVAVAAPSCDPDVLWRLFATPSQWPRWSPHIRQATAATGTSARTVRRGQEIRIDSWGPGYVTAVITKVDEPNRWDFRVDPPLGHRIEAAHEVRRAPVAVRVVMTVHGPLPGPAGSALLATYRPLAAYALRRLVALAGRDPA